MTTEDKIYKVYHSFPNHWITEIKYKCNSLIIYTQNYNDGYQEDEIIFEIHRFEVALENEGIVLSYEGDSAINKKKRYYKITVK
jgi:hypothetical protein